MRLSKISCIALSTLAFAANASARDCADISGKYRSTQGVDMTFRQTRCEQLGVEVYLEVGGSPVSSTAYYRLDGVPRRGQPLEAEWVVADKKGLTMTRVEFSVLGVLKTEVNRMVKTRQGNLAVETTKYDGGGNVTSQSTEEYVAN